MKFRTNGFARGQTKPGVMNKTEAEYGASLELMKRACEIVDYKYEAVKLRLADKTFYTPDFLVIGKDMIVEFHEIKGGFIREKSEVKFKCAAEQFPWFDFQMHQKKNKQWNRIR